MADTIPNLWPEDLKVDVLTPLAILKAQAGTLGRVTRGILEARVTVERSEGEAGDSTTQIHFDLIAPALDRAGFRIMTSSYKNGMPYPVAVESGYFDLSKVFGNPSANFDHHHPADEDEFMRSVSNILKSKKTTSLVQSLIARSNELLAPDRPTTDDLL